MKMLLTTCFLAVSVFACSKENKSQVKLIDSDDTTLQLNAGIYSEAVSIDQARMSLNIDKSGQIDYTIRADIAIADISNKTFTFKRIYRANPQFVMYNQFKKMELKKVVPYTEKGMHLANFKKTGETATSVELDFTHLASGISGTVVVTEGEFGIVSIQSIELSGQTQMKVEDPNGRTEIEYTQTPYYPYYFSREVSLKLLGMISGDLSVTRVK
jgi:hypothetical protein